MILDGIISIGRMHAMSQVIEGTLQEIIERYPELAGKRVRLYVLDSPSQAQNLLEFLGDWVGAINIPNSIQAAEVEQVVEQAIFEKLLGQAKR